VLLRHGEVRLPLVRALRPVLIGAVPVHPVPEPDALFSLHAREAVDPLLARTHEPVDARLGVPRDEVLDVSLVVELQFLLDLDFPPQPLAVEPLLVAEFVAGHREVAVVGVLVGAAPGVVDAHRVVRRDRAVEERPAGLAAVQLLPLLENALPVPEREDRPLQGGEIDVLGLDPGERAFGRAWHFRLRGIGHGGHSSKSLRGRNNWHFTTGHPTPASGSRHPHNRYSRSNLPRDAPAKFALFPQSDNQPIELASRPLHSTKLRNFSLPMRPELQAKLSLPVSAARPRQPRKVNLMAKASTGTGTKKAASKTPSKSVAKAPTTRKKTTAAPPALAPAGALARPTTKHKFTLFNLLGQP